MKNIKPGEFTDMPENFVLPKPLYVEPKLEYSDKLIAMYTAFKEEFFSPKSVLYPSCGFDASPSKVFDNVTYVDREDGNIGCVKKLKEAGLHAIKQDIRDYKPKEKHDLLILLNPAIDTEWATRHVGRAHIIANNYHGTASDLHSRVYRYTLVGSIDFVEKDRRKDDNKAVISRDLTHLFSPVQDEADLLKFRPEYHAFLKKVFGPSANFEEAWEQHREQLGERMPSRRVAETYIFLQR
jgi:hypothetical protein